MRITWSAVGSLAIVVTSFVGANPPVAHAQAATRYVSGGPVLVHGVGNRKAAWQVGAGGEKGAGVFGVGGGVDYVYFPEVNRTFMVDGLPGASSAPAFGVAAISVRGSFYPNRDREDRRTQPFVTGGVTYLLTREAPPLLSVGGGFDWWATPKKGVRFEVLEQSGLLSFRCGIVLR